MSSINVLSGSFRNFLPTKLTLTDSTVTYWSSELSTVHIMFLKIQIVLLLSLSVSSIIQQYDAQLLLNFLLGSGSKSFVMTRNNRQWHYAMTILPSNKSL
ncbi:hypothetical protein HanRHA438_Chr07g0309611 [Helianthus annuus]|nr:hypothetical protein HanRHA438_Chr07g0309611 [Helianthus annuus]